MLKFYLDFEATQFSNQIISIGCEAETGESFYLLVKPTKNAKVTAFITKLTGITEEMLKNAPPADTAFRSFYGWVMDVCRNHDRIPPEFYTYGNDVKYIESTMRHMETLEGIMAASAIKGLVNDYSQVANEKFSQAVALRNLVAIILSSDEIEQKHNALEDARWLHLVADNLGKIPAEAIPKKTSQKSNPPSNSGVISKGPFPIPQFKNLSLEPEHINLMRNGENHMWANVADGALGTREDWVVRVWNTNNDGHEAFFRNVEDAVYWSFKVSGKSMKDANVCRKRWAEICKRAKKGEKFCHVFWEIKSVEQEEK